MYILRIERGPKELWRLVERKCTANGFSRTDYEVKKDAIRDLKEAKWQKRIALRPKMKGWTPETSKRGWQM